MAYSFTNSKGVTYYLHTRRTMAASGKERVLYFFAKEIKDGAMDAVPMGYNVVEMKTGLPVLKKAETAAPAPEPPATPQF
jgi:hypothetical protein